MRSATPAFSTRALAWLGRLGRPGRRLALHLDRRRFRHARAIRVRPADETRIASDQASWYRTMWEEAARAIGAVVEEGPSGQLVVRKGDAHAVVSDHRLTLDDPATIALALDKARVHRLLNDSKVPVPDYMVAAAADRAAGVRFLGEASGPFVVKPADGAGGGGVTCAVETVDDLWRAWLAATDLSTRVMVERAVPGDEYRLLFLDGRLLDVVRREPPRVQGDGRSTVGSLITAENQRRLAAGGRGEVTRLLHVDLDCELTLREQGLSLASVPADGTAVMVKRAVSDNAAAENVTVHDLADDIVDVAATAVSQVGLRLAGVDLIAPDRTRSLTESGGAILEVNGTPGLHYHYQVVDPANATPIADPILDALFTAAPDR